MGMGGGLGNNAKANVDYSRMVASDANVNHKRDPNVTDSLVPNWTPTLAAPQSPRCLRAYPCCHTASASKNRNMNDLIQYSFSKGRLQHPLGYSAVLYLVHCLEPNKNSVVTGDHA